MYVRPMITLFPIGRVCKQTDDVINELPEGSWQVGAFLVKTKEQKAGHPTTVCTAI